MEGAAQAYANCPLPDTFVKQAYKLLIDKLRAACQLRLRVVRFCFSDTVKVCACSWPPHDHSAWLCEPVALAAQHAQLLLQAEQRVVKSINNQATPQQELEWKQSK